MAAPNPQALGTVVQGTGALTVAWPAHIADDIGVLYVESANQAVSAPAGWTEIDNDGTGTGGQTAATRVTAFWKRAASAAEADVAVADSGARQIAVIQTFRGCIASGSPVDVTASSVQATVSTSVTFPGVTTTVDEACIVNVLSNSLLVGAETIQQTTVVNASLANIVHRLNTQEYHVPAAEPGSNILPVGFMAFGSGGASGDVGEGPGLDAASPRCSICMYVPNINTIGAQIDVADQHNITLLLNVAGNKQSYTTTINGVPTLDMGKYQTNVRRFRPDADNTAFPDRLKFADAVRRKRILFYGVDEPYLGQDWNSTLPDISPVQTNQMCLFIKSLWSAYGALTFVRADAQKMADGWNGSSRPSGGWTGVDYCWYQYENRAGKGGIVTGPWLTPVEPVASLQEQRAIIAANNLNMGLACSLNLWAGGIGNNVLGVSAAWDTGNDGGPSGYVLGDREGASMATEVTSLTNSIRSLAANPDWIEKFAEELAADAEVPFLLYWQHGKVGGASDEHLAYYVRADYEAAFDAAITHGLGRVTFNGLRTPK